MESNSFFSSWYEENDLEKFLNEKADIIQEAYEELSNSKQIFNYSRGTWAISIWQYPTIGYMVEMILCEKILIPIWVTYDREEAILVAKFTAAAMKAKCVNKVTNCLTGEVLNIEVRSFGGFEDIKDL